VLQDWVYLVRIDNIPITEQNRKFGITEKFNNVANVVRADGTGTKFYPEDSNKKIFKFTWKFIANNNKGNFDFLAGRDHLKSVADADTIHTLGLRDPISNSFVDVQDYSVVVKSYSEKLVRRAVITDTVNGVESYDAEPGVPLHQDSVYGKYFWDIDMEFEEIGPRLEFA
jgi:hypothetical protein